MAGIQLSGLASGFDWKSVVDQLMQIEQTPITRMQQEQVKNSQRSNALTSLDTKMTALQTSVNALNTSGLFSKRTASSSVSGSTWSASASDGTVASSYKISVTELATVAQWNGASDIGKPLDSTGSYPTASVATLMSSLPTGVPVTAGTFTINGNRVDVALTDSLDTVLSNINTATGGAVTATYNNTTDKLELRSSVPLAKIVLGSGNDSSNFLQAMRLANNGSGSIDSSSVLGTMTPSAVLQNSRLATPLTDPNADGSGSFSINGTTITYNFKTDSLNTVLSKISTSTAGVNATYDSVNDRVVLTNKTTGNVGFSVKDVTGNLMAALKMDNASGDLKAGNNAQFTINDGGPLSSMSNTLDVSAHGIAGLSITVNSKTTENITVANDVTSAKSSINDFISKFNDVENYIETQTKITSVNGKVSTSVLSSNSEVQNWSRNLRSLAFGSLNDLTGTIKRLDSLGIGFASKDNTLSITDTTKLDTALKTNATDVSDFFSNTTSGFVSSMSKFFTSTLGSAYGTTKGSVDNQLLAITNANTSLDNQIAAIQRQLVEKRSILESSFIAMESSQSKTNTILAQLSKVGN